MKTFKFLLAVFFVTLLFATEGTSQDLIDWDGRRSNPKPIKGRLAPSSTISDATLVYPNPFSSEIKINCGCIGEFGYSIFSIDGKQVKKGTLNVTGTYVSIATDNLAEGMYILHIKDNEENTLLSRKLIKGK